MEFKKKKCACHPYAIWLKVIVFLYLRLGYKNQTCDCIWRKQISVLRIQVFEWFLYSEFQIIDPGSVTHIPQFKRICVQWINHPIMQTVSKPYSDLPEGCMSVLTLTLFTLRIFFFLFCHGFLFDKSWSCDFGFKFTLNLRQYVWSCV